MIRRQGETGTREYGEVTVRLVGGLVLYQAAVPHYLQRAGSERTDAPSAGTCNLTRG
jgi:hypothetical protein